MHGDSAFAIPSLCIHIIELVVLKGSKLAEAKYIC